ncbi:MAG: DUF4357 domain-containing protein [Rhizobiaceae bacterium]|nr:DUF4357 domain-containing protein [Rhizobiaceae bacterium]
MEQLTLLLPMVGFDLFRSQLEPVSQARADGIVFSFATAGASATAKETDDGFVVLAGSTARRAPSETFPRGYLALRDQLVAEGKLVEGPSPELYVFAVDVAFSSPSAAASIVAARSAGGPREWRVKDTGQSYAEWRASRLDE